jgi:hypothetical protein
MICQIHRGLSYACKFALLFCVYLLINLQVLLQLTTRFKSFGIGLVETTLSGSLNSVHLVYSKLLISTN